MEEEGKEALWLLLKSQRLPRPFSCIVMVVVYYPPGQPATNEITIIIIIIIIINGIKYTPSQ